MQCTPSHLRWVSHKPNEGQVFMLDVWGVCDNSPTVFNTLDLKFPPAQQVQTPKPQHKKSYFGNDVLLCWFVVLAWDWRKWKHTTGCVCVCFTCWLLKLHSLSLAYMRHCYGSWPLQNLWQAWVTVECGHYLVNRLNQLSIL